MADPPAAPDPNDDTGVRAGRESMRRRRHWVLVLRIMLVKLAVVALLLILPSGLAISLGAAHGVALLLLLVSAAATLVLYRLRGKTLRPALSHRPPYGHGLVPAWGRRKISRMLKNRGGQ